MQKNAKSLKRNDKARKGILIAPSKLPRFFLDHWDSFIAVFSTAALNTASASGPNFAARMASRRFILVLSLGDASRKSAGNFACD